MMLAAGLSVIFANRQGFSLHNAQFFAAGKAAGGNEQIQIILARFATRHTLRERAREPGSMWISPFFSLRTPHKYIEFSHNT